jgi:hypothetical protein
VRADAGASAAAPLTGTNESLMKTLGAAIEEVQTLPPSQRKEGFEEAAKTVKAALVALKEQGGVAMFNSYTGRTLRRNVRFARLHCCCANTAHSAPARAL